MWNAEPQTMWNYELSCRSRNGSNSSKANEKSRSSSCYSNKSLVSAGLIVSIFSFSTVLQRYPHSEQLIILTSDDVKILRRPYKSRRGSLKGAGVGWGGLKPSRRSLIYNTNESQRGGRRRGARRVSA